MKRRGYLKPKKTNRAYYGFSVLDTRNGQIVATYGNLNMKKTNIRRAFIRPFLDYNGEVFPSRMEYIKNNPEISGAH